MSEWVSACAMTFTSESERQIEGLQVIRLRGPIYDIFDHHIQLPPIAINQFDRELVAVVDGALTTVRDRQIPSHNLD